MHKQPSKRSAANDNAIDNEADEIDRASQRGKNLGSSKVHGDDLEEAIPSSADGDQWRPGHDADGADDADDVEDTAVAADVDDDEVDDGTDEQVK